MGDDSKKEPVNRKSLMCSRNGTNGGRGAAASRKNTHEKPQGKGKSKVTEETQDSDPS